jgi:hypothetical protein
MFDGMVWPTIVLFAVVVGAICSNYRSKVRWLTLIGVMVATIGGFAQWYLTFHKEAENREFRTQLPEVDEASGGTLCLGNIYVVDDEKKTIFSLRRTVSGRYEVRDQVPLCSQWKTGDDGEPLCKNFVDADDLEGAACHNGYLYLVTSQSDNRKGVWRPERQTFLKVDLATRPTVILTEETSEKVCSGPTESTGSGCTRADHQRLARSPLRPRSLRCAIDKVLQTKPVTYRDTSAQRVQVEGLAISPEGVVYLGLKSPITQSGNAIVLITSIDRIFENDPEFRYTELDLKKGGIQSISSLEYDDNSKRVLILANLEEGGHTTLWSWNPAGVEPRLIEELNLSDKKDAKGEALVVNGNDLLVLSDVQHYGHWKSFPRSILGRAE